MSAPAATAGTAAHPAYGTRRAPGRRVFAAFLVLVTVWPCVAGAQTAAAPSAAERPRVIVSTDIGGSDPDDQQSMVHYLLYADRFDTEGIVSSPPGAGRKEHILEVLDAYERDFAALAAQGRRFPAPDALRAVAKQGALTAAPSPGHGTATEGSDWIIRRADADDPRPLWVLVWGCLTDVAQAVHDAPRIKNRLRVYSIGSWNTSQDRSARDYLHNSHPDLWWIESDTTFRGMYVGGDQSGDLGNLSFVEAHVRHHGALGDFFHSKKADIKMGDTPSVLYLLYGPADQPDAPHWGGAFRATGHGAHHWTDVTDAAQREGKYAGARTVNVWRRDYLRDWQARMDWIGAR